MSVFGRGFRLGLAGGVASVLVAVSPDGSSAADKRELAAHLHGSGQLNVAIEGNAVVMEFEAPGADIVGFEHAATSDADSAAVDAAVAKLEAPLRLFVLPGDACCTVKSAKVRVVASDDAHRHGHEDRHSEFRAKYMLDCANPAEIDRIEFNYFERFPAARELGVQVISDEGVKVLEVERDMPLLDL